MQSHSLGVDIGGTFTDIVLYDHAQSRPYSRKVLTTHECQTSTPMAAVFLAERTRFPAPGLGGGGEGALGDIQINDRSVDARSSHILQYGDRLLVRTPGAGGYGDVRQRTTEQKVRDKLAGWADTPTSP